MPFLPVLKKIGSPRFRRWFIDNAPFKSVQVTKNHVDALTEMAVSVLENKKRAAEKKGSDVLKDDDKDLLSIFRQCLI